MNNNIYILIILYIISIPIFCILCYAIYQECKNKNKNLYIRSKEYFNQDNSNQVNYNNI